MVLAIFFHLLYVNLENITSKKEECTIIKKSRAKKQIEMLEAEYYTTVKRN